MFLFIKRDDLYHLYRLNTSTVLDLIDFMRIWAIHNIRINFGVSLGCNENERLRMEIFQGYSCTVIFVLSRIFLVTNVFFVLWNPLSDKTQLAEVFSFKVSINRSISVLTTKTDRKKKMNNIIFQGNNYIMNSFLKNSYIIHNHTDFHNIW